MLIQHPGSNYKSKTILINESGLYSLILSSKLPQAREFKCWVTSEVLGQIRKMGGYILINGCELVLWFYSSIIFRDTPYFSDFQFIIYNIYNYIYYIL